jgi:hypothetical protein
LFNNKIARSVGLTLFALAFAAPARLAQADCPQVDIRESIAAIGSTQTQGTLGLPDQASINIGTCITLKLVIIRQTGSIITMQDVTTDPNTHFSTNPARGTFSGPNGSVWCPTTAECNLEFPIYGTFYDTCTGTTFTDTVHVHINPCGPTTLDPTISCAGLDTTVNAETGQCGAHVTLGMPVVGGGVPPLTTVCTAPIGPNGSTVTVSSGTVFPVGSTLVTCTVTDHVGQTANCSFTVTVLPSAPTITCPGNITTPCTGVATFAAVAHSNCPGTLTITYWIGSPTLAGGTVIGSPHTFPLGTTTVYAQATAPGDLTSNICSFTVTVPSCPSVLPQQGCTPGYWKTHTSAWQCYSTTTTVGSVFHPVVASLSGNTLLQALQGSGGSDLAGAETILLRAATAALLNACPSRGLTYPLTDAQIISMVNAALATGNRDTILTLATTLDTYNNLGCPLN